MTPEQLARDAARLVDKLERAQLLRILTHLKRVEEDARTIITSLSTSDTSTARIIREARARQVLAQSRAAQELLALGSNAGPVAEAFRTGIQQAYSDGIRSATRAAVDAGILTSGQAAAFTPRVELELISAITETTLTTLEKVSAAGLFRLEDAIVRGAVRGEGPRAAARLVRQSLNLTRYEAERITRTVFMRANNEARDAMWDDLDVDYLRWDATNDERTCEHCASRHGEIYERRAAPQPPGHPMCRCVLLPFNPSTAHKHAAYYERTREELAEARGRTTPRAAMPFERMDGVIPPTPVTNRFEGAVA